MKTNYDLEKECIQKFNELDECHHVWTPENFEIIFNERESFKAGMGIIGLAALMHPEIKILTFEIMTNHLHFTISGDQPHIMEMFNTTCQMLKSYKHKFSHIINWDYFKPGIRKLETLEDLRNVIVYNNRNGYIISPDHTPFSYPF